MNKSDKQPQEDVGFLSNSWVQVDKIMSDSQNHVMNTFEQKVAHKESDKHEECIRNKLESDLKNGIRQGCD